MLKEEPHNLGSHEGVEIKSCLVFLVLTLKCYIAICFTGAYFTSRSKAHENYMDHR